MRTSFRLTTRHAFKWIHTWVGLVAGLVVAVVSLTGSVVVFRSEMERASAPHGSAGAAVVGLDEISRQVVSVSPDAKIRRVRFPAEAGDPFIVQVDSSGKTERLVCDASTGHVLGTLKTGWIDWTIDLHRNLLSGKTGRKATGITGIVLFALAATGMLLWLSGARHWRSWISVRPQTSSRRFYFELHRATGLWSYGLLTAIALTGIGLSFPDTFRGALRSLTGDPLPSKAPRVNQSASLRPLDEYLRDGAAALPDGTPTELRLPDAGKGPIDLRSRRPGDLAPGGNHVYLEPSTAKVMSISKAADQPLATRIFAAIAPIHYGEFGGLPVKLIWGILGLLPSLLLVTGLIAWWRPKPPKKPLVVREDLDLVGSSQASGR